MQNLVNIYNQNKKLVIPFIRSSLKQIDLDLALDQIEERLFNTFPSLELIYTANDEYVQNSQNIYRNNKEDVLSNQSRRYLLKDPDVEFYIKDPYISVATDHLCITVVYKTKSGYLFLDFRVRYLLERFDLIETKTGMNLVNKIAYASIGGGLLFFAVFLVLYGFYDFGSYFVGYKLISLETVFKPIISLTLGLAVYDLGKTILDEEVLPKTHHKREGFNAKTLLKFSVSIIIALLIEALLVVFKIALLDYKDMGYAAMLIAAISMLILVFGVFIYLTKKNN